MLKMLEVMRAKGLEGPDVLGKLQAFEVMKMLEVLDMLNGVEVLIVDVIV